MTAAVPLGLASGSWNPSLTFLLRGYLCFFLAKNDCLLRGAVNMPIEHLDDKTYSPSGQFLEGMRFVLPWPLTMSVQVLGAAG